VRSAKFALAAFALLSGCSPARGELREWQASDHQPPAAAEATGQGEGGEGGDPQVRAALALWAMRCADCHGASGRGDGQKKPPGASVPDFSDPTFQQERSDERLAEVIFKGQGLMPAFGEQLSPTGIAALVAHIRSLSRQR
jgi:mono/diheme cytochrome c family protein